MKYWILLVFTFYLGLQRVNYYQLFLPLQNFVNKQDIIGKGYFSHNFLKEFGKLMVILLFQRRISDDTRAEQ